MRIVQNISRFDNATNNSYDTPINIILATFLPQQATVFLSAWQIFYEAAVTKKRAAAAAAAVTNSVTTPMPTLPTTVTAASSTIFVCRKRCKSDIPIASTDSDCFTNVNTSDDSGNVEAQKVNTILTCYAHNLVMFDQPYFFSCASSHRYLSLVINESGLPKMTMAMHIYSQML